MSQETAVSSSFDSRYNCPHPKHGNELVGRFNIFFTGASCLKRYETVGLCSHQVRRRLGRKLWDTLG